MQNFELSLDEEVQLYINNNLTPNELFILRLIFLAVDDEQKPLINYLSNVSNGKQLMRSVLKSLQEKQVINNVFKLPKEGEVLNFKLIPFNKNFLKMYIRETHAIGKEFLDAYPPFINIKGRMYSIKNFTKAGLFSVEAFCNYYAKTIKNSGFTHERILKALEFGKEHNLIHYSILEFIASEKYKEIEYIQQSDDINGYTNSELL
jgi:hypothetical protein